jgi:hypothetical protein
VSLPLRCASPSPGCHQVPRPPYSQSSNEPSLEELFQVTIPCNFFGGNNLRRFFQLDNQTYISDKKIIEDYISKVLILLLPISHQENGQKINHKTNMRTYLSANLPLIPLRLPEYPIKNTLYRREKLAGDHLSTFSQNLNSYPCPSPLLQQKGAHYPRSPTPRALFPDFHHEFIRQNRGYHCRAANKSKQPRRLENRTGQPDNEGLQQGQLTVFGVPDMHRVLNSKEHWHEEEYNCRAPNIIYNRNSPARRETTCIQWASTCVGEMLLHPVEIFAE